MTYGLNIFNKDGYYAITDASSNFHYMGSYNASQTQNGQTANNQYCSFAFYNNVLSPNKPIIFCEPVGTSRFTVIAIQPNGSNWQVVVEYTTSAPKIHAFAQLSTTTPSSSYGLIVRRANNTIAFDSSAKPLSFHTITTFSGSDAPLRVDAQSLENNDSFVTLVNLPARAAFLFYQNGMADYCFDVTNTTYRQYHATTFRNGNEFHKIWKRSTNYGSQQAVEKYYFNDTFSPKPLLVIDAARYDF